MLAYELQVEREGAVENEVVEGRDEVAVEQLMNNNSRMNSHPSWQGVKLFPPKKVSKNPSRVWQYGGFRKGQDGQLKTENTVCGICGEEQKFRNTPAHLRQHLKNHHAGQVDLEVGESTESKTPSIKDYLRKASAGSKVSKYKPNHPKQKDFRAEVDKWIIASKRPLYAVEDDHLVAAFGLADPKLTMPTRFMVTKDIRAMFLKEKARTIQELKQVEALCSTNDGGSTSGAKSFVDVNIHYVTEDFKPRKKILDVFEMKESKTAENYRARVKEVERKYGIEGKVFSYTTDNEATMRKAFSREERNGCFAHIESKSCKNILNNQKAFKPVRVKMRKIAKKANKSSKFKYSLQKQQQSRGLRQLTLKQEVKTRFTATWTMIRSFLNDPNEKKDDDLDEEKVEANIQAINSAMIEAKFKKKQFDALQLKNEDVSKMKQLVKVHFMHNLICKCQIS